MGRGLGNGHTCPLSVLKTVLANVERSKLVLQRAASDAFVGLTGVSRSSDAALCQGSYIAERWPGCGSHPLELASHFLELLGWLLRSFRLGLLSPSQKLLFSPSRNKFLLEFIWFLFVADVFNGAECIKQAVFI